MTGPAQSSFEPRVLAVLGALAPGEVVSYGDVAAEAGFPRAARAVGTLLRVTAEPVPWWRVVTSTGRLVPGHEREQARRLIAEGVEVIDGRVRRPPRRRSPATPPSPSRRRAGR